jgi:Ca2+/H+ antiporter
MKALLKEIRDNPLLWLLSFVPVVFIAGKVWPESHTLLFLLSVLAIVPLATLLSHATESVAAKTGDAGGGLLNATLGNLPELVIALAAAGDKLFDQPSNFFPGPSCPPFLAYLIFVHLDLLADRDQFW